MKNRIYLILGIVMILASCGKKEIKECDAEEFLVEGYDEYPQNLQDYFFDIVQFGREFQDDSDRYGFCVFTYEDDKETHYVMTCDWKTGRTDTLKQFNDGIFYTAAAPVSGDSLWILSNYYGVFCSKGNGRPIWPEEEIPIVGSDYGITGFGPMTFNLSNSRLCVSNFYTNYDISDELVATPAIPVEELRKWQHWSLWTIVNADSIRYYRGFGARHFDSDSIYGTDEQMIYNEDDSIYIHTTTGSNYVVLFDANGDSLCRKEFASKRFVAKRAHADYDIHNQNEREIYRSSNCWYGNIYYDKYRKQYIRIMKMPDTEVAAETTSMTKKTRTLYNFNVVVADKDFNVKYEVAFRNSGVMSLGCIVREEGCYFMENAPDTKKGWRVRLYNFYDFE